MSPSRYWLLVAKSFTSSSPAPKEDFYWDGKIFPLIKERVGVALCHLLSQLSHTED